MKRITKITSSLAALALLVVLGLAGIMPSVLSQVGVQTAVQADTQALIRLDVAIDCRTWRNNLGISFGEMARGDSFIAKRQDISCRHSSPRNSGQRSKRLRQHRHLGRTRDNGCHSKRDS